MSYPPHLARTTVLGPYACHDESIICTCARASDTMIAIYIMSHCWEVTVSEFYSCSPRINARHTLTHQNTCICSCATKQLRANVLSWRRGNLLKALIHSDFPPFHDSTERSWRLLGLLFQPRGYIRFLTAVDVYLKDGSRWLTARSVVGSFLRRRCRSANPLDTCCQRFNLPQLGSQSVNTYVRCCWMNGVFDCKSRSRCVEQ